MPALSFTHSDPNNFILVADHSFSEYHPQKDQVWMLKLDTSDSYPFALSTTYGLQAKSMRLFPNFIIDNQRISKPADFFQPPRVTFYSPSAVKIEAAFSDNVVLLFDGYLPEPDVLLGCFHVKNIGESAFDLIIQLAANLNPMGKGHAAHPEKSGNNHFLVGKTDHLEPVLFMTGGAMGVTNPFSALSVQTTIEPKGFQEIPWVLVSKESKTASLDEARKVIASEWSGNLLDHTMKSMSQTIQIKTGDPDWDSAFFLAQVHAKTHLVQCQDDAPGFRFIKVRHPDQSTFSEPGEPNLEQITILELNHLRQVLLPANVPELKSLTSRKLIRFKDQLQNHNEAKVTLKNKPTVPCPLLGTIALEIYEISQDQDFLTQIFPALSKIFHLWTDDHAVAFNNEAITWDTPERLNCETGLYIFNLWESYGKGLDIQKVESPALYALLYKEAKALYKISRILGEGSEQRFFSQWQKNIFKRLEGCWREDKTTYGYQDIQTHTLAPEQWYFPNPIKEEIVFNKNFTSPQRLQVHVFTSDEHTRACVIQVKGTSPQGDTIEEIFKSTDIRWILGRAHITTENLFSEITTIQFKGLKETDRFIVETADYSQLDITCLLPLWGEAGSETHRQKIATKWLNLQDPDLIHGIPEVWQSQQPLPDELPVRVNVLWNTLIIDGLYKHNQVEKAADLFSQLMTSIIHGLKKYDGFYPFFDSRTGEPIGQHNGITGFPPIALFLKIAGVKLFSPTQVALWGHNPFPWPIEIHWQGLSILRDKLKTKITFPNGETYHHESGKSTLLTSETKTTS